MAVHSGGTHGELRGLYQDLLGYPTQGLRDGQVFFVEDRDEMYRWKSEDGGWTKSSYAKPIVSLVIVFINPDGVAAGNHIVFRFPSPYTLMKMYAWRTGGTGVSVNARRNGSDEHLASSFSVVNSGGPLDCGVLQNADYEGGDYIEVRVISPAGNPTLIGIQCDFQPA